MSDEVYKQLRQLLDRFPTGCPDSPEIIEILKILFTQEEAKVALGLGFRPFSVEDIASRAGVEEDKAIKHLESLANKGVVYAREKEGNWGYSLLPVMPGMFEFPYMKGIHDETINKLTPLWKEYLPKLGQGFGTPGMAITRIVPIQEEVESEPGILLYEKVYEMIENAKAVGIAHCACRELEQACDAPREACMVFDDTCNFLVDRGFARHLSKEEMKEKLKEFDEAGLVHQVNNSQDRLTLICNCCPCCCELLRVYTEYGNPNVLATSGFLPVNDTELCTGCAICADDRCPMQAIEIVDEVAVVDAQRCIGCGLCVTGCPEEAMHMDRKEEYIEPPETTAEMGIKILTEKGKLEEFMQSMKP